MSTRRPKGAADAMDAAADELAAAEDAVRDLLPEPGASPVPVPVPTDEPEPDVWAPAASSVEAALHASRRIREQVTQTLDVTQAALAEERAAHYVARRRMAEMGEAFARDRLAWDEERAALLAAADGAATPDTPRES